MGWVDGMEWDRMGGWMGWDETGWHGFGWDGIGWIGTGASVTFLCFQEEYTTCRGSYCVVAVCFEITYI